MPIISEGYASTNIQGGTRGITKTEEPSEIDSTAAIELKANVIEEAKVEEISSRRYATI